MHRALIASSCSLALVVSLGATPRSAAALTPQARAFALVVGNNTSARPDTPTLRYADDDAIATYLLLREADVDTRLLVAPDEDTTRMRPRLEPLGAPTKTKLFETFDTMVVEMEAAKKAGHPVHFFFYYSGHGDVEHGEGYVELVGGRLGRADLMERILERSPATRNHVVIDACKSFFLVFGKGATGERQKVRYALVDQAGPARFPNTGFVLSTSSDRDSHEWEGFGGGIFSHEVRSALWGAADVNTDGVISYGELGAFLRVANRRIRNARYRPDYTVLPPSSDGGSELSEPLLEWTGPDDSLVVDKATGHVYIESRMGVRVMDVNPRRGTKLVLHLPKSRPLFIRRADNKREWRVDKRRAVRLSALMGRQAGSTRKGALHVAFQSLFKAPFGARDVDFFAARYSAAVASLRDDQQPVTQESLDLASSQQPELSPDLEDGLALSLEDAAVGPPRAFLVLAGVATAVVVGGQAWAYWERQRGTRHRAPTGVELQRHNEQITRLNTASLAAAGVAAAAGGLWLGLELLSDQGKPTQHPSGMVFGVGARF